MFYTSLILVPDVAPHSGPVADGHSRRAPPFDNPPFRDLGPSLDNPKVSLLNQNFVCFVGEGKQEHGLHDYKKKCED